eukprot:TRINITY_DN2401_c0_g1_i1.p1 TRINITY_DN2401_c0_g1~~TRINITY_DN2401_c0_g1_i1.p1  ORF type:complete len:321 (-),score=84.46 TRINITY_DN2401_c0_g1_i1:54-1016(-)
MRPLLLKGHERAITFLKYNEEGDILYTASKHPSFACWRTSDGERLGTFDGHDGAVWSVDVDRKTSRVLSGSADNYAKLWDAETGKNITTWRHQTPVRSVEFGLGDKQFITSADQLLDYLPTINIYDVNSSVRSILTIQNKKETKILQATWGPLNRTILAATEDGRIIIYDTRNGNMLRTIDGHTKAVTNIQWNKNGTMFITSSRDGYAKLYDSNTYQHLKTYYTGRPINSASISPIKDEVILGGGESAQGVAKSGAGKSQFNTRFFHLIFEDEIGSIPGHFGPVNYLSFNPDGDGFASGGEDGYVRVLKFDKNYLSTNYS